MLQCIYGLYKTINKIKHYYKGKYYGNLPNNCLKWGYLPKQEVLNTLIS